MQTTPPVLAGLIFLAPLCVAQQTELESIQSILRVGSEGAHNAEASKAVAALSKAHPAGIPVMLSGMNSANELAANYLRSCVDDVVDRTLRAGGTLPVAEIRAFLLDTSNHPRARRLAYEILVKVAPADAAGLLPGFANDPSVELRYDAVELLVKKADALRDANGGEGQKPEVVAAYQTALNAAREQKQIEKIAAQLRTLGAPVDLPRHFGFITHWKVIGPFDNSNLAGFDTAYPPEREFNAAAEYEGKGAPVRWKDASTGEDYGKVDLNAPLGELKEVTGYAVTEFNSPIEGPAELRLGCKNGWKVWFNGDFLFGRDEYHRGSRIDQYRLPVVLKKGANRILLKLCQNADVKDWTREWEFQLRVCDAAGTAILATDRPPTPSATPKAAPRTGGSKK